MTLSLTVLGSAGTHPGPGRACSSYLLDADGFRLLLDCGNGSLSNLQRVCSIRDVDAVLLSHLHHDHWADLVGLYYARRFLPEGPLPVPVYAVEGAEGFVNQLLSGYDTFGEVCRFTTVAAGDELHIGPVQVELFGASHPVEAVITRATHDGRVLTYTGDTGPTDAVANGARDADLLVADATWLERQRPLPEHVHMTAREAGEQAQRAGARLLLLSHLYVTTDPQESVAEAASVFDGDVRAASDLLEIVL